MLNDLVMQSPWQLCLPLHAGTSTVNSCPVLKRWVDRSLLVFVGHRVLLGQRRSLQLDRVDLRGRTRPSRACLATKPGTFNERPSFLSFLFLLVAISFSEDCHQAWVRLVFWCNLVQFNLKKIHFCLFNQNYRQWLDQTSGEWDWTRYIIQSHLSSSISSILIKYQ
jgi:hypothetical protein